MAVNGMQSSKGKYLDHGAEPPGNNFVDTPPPPPPLRGTPCLIALQILQFVTDI